MDEPEPSAEARDRRRRSPRNSRRGHRAERDQRRDEDRPRRTQAERSAETTARLLDATADCLCDLGYVGASTTEICRRAGVSRGALLHHFATKDELVAAGVQHVFQRAIDEFRARLAEVPHGPGRNDAVVDTLWQLFRGPTFDAWLELIVAGRTDRGLQRHVARQVDRLGETVQATLAELDPPTDDAPPADPVLPYLVFCVLEGMALNRHTGSPLVEDVNPLLLDRLKHLTAAGATPPPAPTEAHDPEGDHR